MSMWVILFFTHFGTLCMSLRPYEYPPICSHRVVWAVCLPCLGLMSLAIRRNTVLFTSFHVVNVHKS